MNNIKISHEVPICLLEESKKFNDYDYVIASHVKKYPVYKSFYLQCKKEGRYMIMDNGLFEDGVPMSDDEYFEIVKEFEPNEFIIPDYWNDTDGTIESIKRWNKDYLPKLDKKSDLQFRTIGVVQGGDVDSATECYMVLRTKVDKIAFNYLGNFYNDVKVSYNEIDSLVDLSSLENDLGIKYLFRLLARKNFIDDLLEYRLFDITKPHHLLGCISPIEFTLYNNSDYAFIQSLDTSHPIITSIQGRNYKSISALLSKSDLKIDSVITTDFSETYNIYFHLKDNIEHIRNLVNG